jgi:hypothetical protein
MPAPSITITGPLERGWKLVPVGYKCPICKPGWMGADPECPACAGKGRVLGYEVK